MPILSPLRLALALALALPLTACAAPRNLPQPWQGAAFEGDRAALEKLAAAGAQVVRVYRERDAWVLDDAQRLGLKVIMGLSIPQRRQSRAIDDPAVFAAHAAQMREFVLRHRNHPALLAWVVGNETELGDTDPRPAWQLVERFAAVVKAADPNHPTMMAVTDNGPEQFGWLADCCAHIDLIGVNVFADAVFDLPRRLAEAGVRKPVVIAELGPLGQWQAGRKPWGAPVEFTSRQKADFFRRALPALRQQPQVIGTLAFLWGAKNEQTPTWHGLLLADGSPTEVSETLAELWGRPPAEPPPSLTGIGISNDEFAPSAAVSASVTATGSQPLRYEWTLYRDADQLSAGKDGEAALQPIPLNMHTDPPGSVRFSAPTEPGPYRLFVTIRDAQGRAATGNLPLWVRDPEQNARSAH